MKRLILLLAVVGTWGIVLSADEGDQPDWRPNVMKLYRVDRFEAVSAHSVRFVDSEGDTYEFRGEVSYSESKGVVRTVKVLDFFNANPKSRVTHGEKRYRIVIKEYDRECGPLSLESHKVFDE